MQPQTPRFHEWLAAEKDAGEAEREIHRQMIKSALIGPAPDSALVLAARAKRVKAHWLFDEAMQELKDLAEALDHRRAETKSSLPSDNEGQQEGELRPSEVRSYPPDAR